MKRSTVNPETNQNETKEAAKQNLVRREASSPKNALNVVRNVVRQASQELVISVVGASRFLGQPVSGSTGSYITPEINTLDGQARKSL